MGGSGRRRVGIRLYNSHVATSRLLGSPSAILALASAAVIRLEALPGWDSWVTA